MAAFTLADSNSFFNPHEILLIAHENKYSGIFKEMSLFYHYDKCICCMFSLESTHQDEANKYTQHSIILYRRIPIYLLTWWYD